MQIDNKKKYLIFGIVSTFIVFFTIQYAIGKLAYAGETGFFSYGSASYSILARSIITSGEYAYTESATAGRPPLYPLFLALFGLKPELILVGQSLLVGATFAALAGIYIFNTHRLLDTLWFVALFLLTFQIAVENVTQRETVLFNFFLAVSALAFSLARKRHYNFPALCVFAVSLGLAALTRPLAILGPFFAVLLAIYLFLLGDHGRNIFVKPIIFLCIFLFTILPWGVRNRIAVGTFTLSSTTSGINLWKGNNPATPHLYPLLDVDELDPLLTNPPEASGWWDNIRNSSELSEAERNKLFTDVAVNHIKENPWQFLRQIPVKIWALWTPRQVPMYTGEVSWTPTGAEIKNLRPFIGSRASYIVLYILTLFGFWQWRTKAYTVYVISLIVFFSLLHGISFGESRFRWPVNVLSIPIAVAGLQFILVKLRFILTTRLHGKTVESRG